jgi:two-component system cell cycle sensor histidine kinase/response regulator CckA
MNGTSTSMMRDALSLLALCLDARFAVLRLADGTVIANDEDAPLQTAAALSERSGDALVVFTPEELAGIEGIRLAVVAQLRDAEGHLLGSMTVMDGAQRQVSWTDRQIVTRIAEQIARSIEAGSRLERMEAVLDAIPVAAYMVENGRLAYVNAKFARTLGYTQSELTSLSSAAEVIVKEQQRFVRDLIRRREAGDQDEIRYVTQVRCRDGTILDAEVHGSVVHVEGRRILIGAAIDISEHTRERKLVQDREEYFRALTENAKDVIAILDQAGRVCYITPSAEAIAGVPPRELIGTVYRDRIHPEDRERFDRDFEGLLARSHASVATAAYRYRSRNGLWRSVESVGTNLVRHPHVRGVVLNTRDITDRKMLEEQVDQLHRLTSLGRLSSQVAHEFNNVLMGIQPVTEIIRRLYSDDAQLRRVAEAIGASIARGKRITTDILRFGRPAQLTLQTVDAEALIRQTGEEIRSLLPANIGFTTTVQDRPLYACADPAQLSQVIINLALNARDAMQTTGGTLTLGVSRGQASDTPNGAECIHFSVTDTGKGIAEDHLPFIFEPLFTTKKTGSGLGLSVVWQIVTAHRGQVSVETEPGEGTTFHIHIPAAVAPAVHDTVIRETSEEESETRVRVLVVEDEPAVAEGLRWSLAMEGYRVTIASTGAEAMPRFEETKPDIVILDLSLPDSSGQVVYERIASVAQVPVIFSSGHAAEHEIRELLHHPQTAFLMKPYSADELLRNIQRLLEDHGITHRHDGSRH